MDAYCFRGNFRSTRTGNFPWFWGVSRQVFTHFRLTLPVQNIKREKLCLPNVRY
jgi:hypothetical protein